MDVTVIHHAMTQYSLRNETQNLNRRVSTEILKDLNQMYDDKLGNPGILTMW